LTRNGASAWEVRCEAPGNRGGRRQGRARGPRDHRVRQVRHRPSRPAREVYQGRVELYLLPRFDSVPLVDIGKPDVIRWRDDLLERVSAATVNTCMGTFSSACTWFAEQGWISVNPCARIKRAKHVARVFPWLQTSEAITRLLSECPDNIRAIVAVLVGTGMRLDEALHLRWDDVDRDHRIITVHRGRKGAPKSGQSAACRSSTACSACCAR
jgi:integrase